MISVKKAYQLCDLPIIGTHLHIKVDISYLRFGMQHDCLMVQINKIQGLKSCLIFNIATLKGVIEFKLRFCKSLV